MLKRALDSRVVWGCFLLAMLASQALAEPNSVRTRISSLQVATALEAGGWNITASQVKFLAQVTADGADPNLEVVEVSKWREGSVKAKLRCSDRRMCVPFLVLIEGVSSEGNKFPRTSSKVQKVAADTVAPPPLMRSGDHVSMVFADKALRISIPVICLQSGGRGQTIRVSSEDHKRFFKAEVIGPRMLRAATL